MRGGETVEEVRSEAREEGGVEAVVHSARLGGLPGHPIVWVAGQLSAVFAAREAGSGRAGPVIRGSISCVDTQAASHAWIRRPHLMRGYAGRISCVDTQAASHAWIRRPHLMRGYAGRISTGEVAATRRRHGGVAGCQGRQCMSKAVPACRASEAVGGIVSMIAAWQDTAGLIGGSSGVILVVHVTGRDARFAEQPAAAQIHRQPPDGTDSMHSIRISHRIMGEMEARMT